MNDGTYWVRQHGVWWCVYAGGFLLSSHRSYPEAKASAVHLNAEARREAMAS